MHRFLNFSAAVLLSLWGAAGLASCSKGSSEEGGTTAVKVEITLEPYMDSLGTFHTPVWKASDKVILTNRSTLRSAAASPSVPGNASSVFVFNMAVPAKGDSLFARYPEASPEFEGITAFGGRTAGEKLSLYNKKASSLIIIEDADYPMLLCDKCSLSEAVSYEKYRLLKQTDAFVHVVKADMASGKVSLEASVADGIVPNPCSESSNNGKRLRETVSENVARNKAAGRKVLSAINGDYYATVPGMPLSCHVEDGEAVFINSPEERRRESYFVYGITQFSDGSLSTDERTVSCKARFAGREVTVYSVNDTLVRLSGGVSSSVAAMQAANVYTHRFVEIPFPVEAPSLSNPIGTRALFLVCRSDGPLAVNSGWTEGRITSVVDGRDGGLSKAPYVSQRGEWVLQLTGSSAEAFSAAKTGDAVEFRADITIGGQTRQIRSHVGGKYRFVSAGKPSTGIDDSHAASRHSMVSLSADGKTLMFITIEWTSSFRAAGSIAMLLGGYNVVKLDGGGSTCMWTGRSGGQLVQKSTDSRGPERSNMNYILLVEKD